MVTSLLFLISAASATISHKIFPDKPNTNLCNCSVNDPYSTFYRCMLDCPNGVFLENVSYEAADICVSDKSLYLPLPAEKEHMYFFGASVAVKGTGMCSTGTVLASAKDITLTGCTGFVADKSAELSHNKWQVGMTNDGPQQIAVIQEATITPPKYQDMKWVQITLDCTLDGSKAEYVQVAAGFIQGTFESARSTLASGVIVLYCALLFLL